MKRYLKYIFLSLVSAVLAVSCLEELEPTPSLTQTDDVAVLVPRVKSFTNQYVTRSGYSEDEAAIKSLKVLIFNNHGALVHTQDMPVDTRTITLNKSMINSPSHKGKLSNATVVMLANIDLTLLKKANGEAVQSSLSSLTLDELAGCTYYPKQNIILSSDLGTSAFDGFPMIGGTSVDLTPTSATNQQDPVVIDLKILFAKIEFEICVEQGSENQGDGMRFTLDNWDINNVSQATTLAVPTDKGEPVRDFIGNIPDEGNVATADEATASSQYTTSPTSGNLPETKTTALNGSPLKFTFYMAESRYNPGTYTYPINDLHESFKQQFKPEVAKAQGGSPAVGMASYVVLKGKYIDYRGTSWNVNYKIYLGKNAYDNFHVDRNSHYKNVISIKGIRDNDDYGTGQVWLDHRVNVTYNDNGADDHVTITRETLIDSHIEVRPLRVKWEEGEYNGVRVYLPTNSDGSLVDWIGIERFTGDNNADGSTYCFAGGKSTGKRKYFTASLISDLQAKEGEFGINEDENTGKKYIYLLNGECAWIYFDENTGTTDRYADITLEFYISENNKQTEVYQVKQRGLLSLGGHTIESYEEYLHSYNSADKYNLSTSPADYTQQGLAWGFAGQTISEDIIVSATQLDASNWNINVGIQGFIDQRYDYFHKSDIPDGETYFSYIKNGNSWTTTSYGTGLIFTDRASAKEGITVKDMGTLPDNAYQYCLSKNKFKENTDGTISMDIHWYLPDVHEMQAVLKASQNATDFGLDAYYWSSQPSNDGFSVKIEIIDREISIKNEDSDNARAVSSSEVKDIKRDVQSRIRCFYDKTGRPADMADRVPDGIGGNYSFYMKAWNGAEPGYFSYMMDFVSTETHTGTVPYTYDNSDYPYPTFDNNRGKFGFFNNAIDENDNVIVGFTDLPTNREKWESYTDYYPDGSIIPSSATFYSILTTFPGLSDEELDYDGLTGKGGARETGKKRKDIQIDSTIIKSTVTRIVDQNTFNDLNDKLLIKFEQSTSNTGNPFPQFTYSAYDEGSKADTTVREWRVPTYPDTTYTQKGDTQYVRGIKGTGTGTVNGFLGMGDTDKAEEDAKTAALNDAIEKARNTYPNRNKYNPVNHTITVTGSWNRWKTTYTATATFNGDIECIAEGGKVKYYQDATNGGWVVKNGYPKTKYLNEIQTDELRMYCGNSFTISLSETAKAEGYQISKVKVYYIGSNLIDGEDNDSVIDGIYSNNVYARFVESSITLPKSETITGYGSTETLQLEGMDYDDSSKWHQWTGIDDDGSVTLILADYSVTKLANTRFTYEYDLEPDSPSKYIVIDRIEVKCAKPSKESTN